MTEGLEVWIPAANVHVFKCPWARHWSINSLPVVVCKNLCLCVWVCAHTCSPFAGVVIWWNSFFTVNVTFWILSRVFVDLWIHTCSKERIHHYWWLAEDLKHLFNITFHCSQRRPGHHIELCKLCPGFVLGCPWTECHVVVAHVRSFQFLQSLTFELWPSEHFFPICLQAHAPCHNNNATRSWELCKSFLSSAPQAQRGLDCLRQSGGLHFDLCFHWWTVFTDTGSPNQWSKTPYTPFIQSFLNCAPPKGFMFMGI